MNPKQKIIDIIFGPAITFFTSKFKISGFVVALIFITIISIPILKTKNKKEIDIVRKIIIILALLIAMIFGVIDTLRIRNMI